MRVKRKYMKTHLTRPRKGGAAKRRRQNDQKNRLITLGIDEEKVQLRKFPKDVLDTFKLKTREVIDEMIGKDLKSKKIFEAYNKFKNSFNDWSSVSDKIYYDL